MTHEARRALWEQRLQTWRQSGLTATAWCREQAITAPSFWYWKRRLTTSSQAGFVQVRQKPPADEITLTVHGVTVHVRRGFDPTLLRQCLQLLLRC